ncbi:MAG: CopG family transcriptional regulator [Devosia sp. 67-54]|uniref:ribbon-helix-helix domain-containing protein n=1 Tax=unclassified Devosia TaxID=196773 RepID=UPI000960B74E|nr:MULTISPECIES: CopG family transcriptional regulator [unclassified Devosia]MBN9306740.1 CopG family transcriptional regulator [Devosia sp.]OJX16004.1 MAG: CopG family transcriptional regulator [Devosia sp. 67-54]
MRTTLAIDDDVLEAAKAMARQQDRSMGEVISDLARRSLRRPAGGGERNGIPLLKARSGTPPVTLETVNALRDELP